MSDQPDMSVELATALAHHRAGRLGPATAGYARVLAVDPDNADALNLLGVAKLHTGESAEAERLAARAVALDPEAPEFHVNHGNALHALGQLGEAAKAFRRALGLDSRQPKALNNLGSVLQAKGDASGAEDSFRRALEIDPCYVSALVNLGNLLQIKGDTVAAVDAYDRALSIDPEFGQAVYYRSLVDLAEGRFVAGWAGYRERPVDFANGLISEPLAASLLGKRVLIRREQGLGDELFFLRFAPILKARGAWLAFDPDPRLYSMLQRAAVVDSLIAPGAPLAADLTVALGDLPFLVGMGNDDPPPPSLPLAPLAEKLEEIRERLAAFGPPPYIAVTWRAGTKTGIGTLFKEAPVAELGRVLAPTAARIVVVQRQPADNEMEAFARALGRPVLDLTGLNDDLEAMLAVMSLVTDYVAVSNTNIYLRAGVGGPVRLLASFPPGYRLMERGSVTPWFPGWPVYRQRSCGDWSEALDTLAVDVTAAYGSAEGGP